MWQLEEVSAMKDAVVAILAVTEELDGKEGILQYLIEFRRFSESQPCFPTTADPLWNSGAVFPSPLDS